jgi:membrane associated rhomboid family serine protease
MRASPAPSCHFGSAVESRSAPVRVRCSFSASLAVLGCPWLSLAAPGLLLVAPGCSWAALGCLWLLLAASGCLWLPLAATGCLWLVLMSTVDPKKTTCMGLRLGSLIYYSIVTTPMVFRPPPPSPWRGVRCRSNLRMPGMPRRVKFICILVCTYKELAATTDNMHHQFAWIYTSNALVTR